MAQYWTDFSEYTTSSQPSDWTSHFHPKDYIVQDDAGAEGGKVLNISNGSTDNDAHALSWDTIDSDANRDDIELLAKIRFTNDTNSNFSL